MRSPGEAKDVFSGEWAVARASSKAWHWRVPLVSEQVTSFTSVLPKLPCSYKITIETAGKRSQWSAVPCRKARRSSAHPSSSAVPGTACRGATSSSLGVALDCIGD